MFRMVYRVGLLCGAAILALFIGARLINMFDPYRVVTENLIDQVAADPLLTVRLNGYGSVASQFRQSWHTEQAAGWAVWLDEMKVTKLVEWFPFRSNVKFVVIGADTAVRKMAAFDATLVSLGKAETLSRNLSQLRFYDWDNGANSLSELYGQSTAVSQNLSDVSEGIEEVATAVSVVTNFPALETVQQEVGRWRDTAAKVGAGEGGLLLGLAVAPEDAAEIVQTADFFYNSIESWQGLPANMQSVKQQIDKDVMWLDGFEQQFVQAKAFNDRWHFDTLRMLPRFMIENHRPLLLGVIGSLLLAIVGWVGSLKQPTVQRRTAVRPPVQPVPPPPVLKPRPGLALRWPDGRHEQQLLPQVGALTVGNIVIRRARVRYYLECIDRAFPVLLNGQSVEHARLLNDGDVVQIGELQTIFQLAA